MRRHVAAAGVCDERDPGNFSVIEFANGLVAQRCEPAGAPGTGRAGNPGAAVGAGAVPAVVATQAHRQAAGGGRAADLSTKRHQAARDWRLRRPGDTSPPGWRSLPAYCRWCSWAWRSTLSSRSSPRTAPCCCWACPAASPGCSSCRWPTPCWHCWCRRPPGLACSAASGRAAASAYFVVLSMAAITLIVALGLMGLLTALLGQGLALVSSLLGNG